MYGVWGRGESWFIVFCVYGSFRIVFEGSRGATLGEWGGSFLFIRGGGVNKVVFLEGEW